MIKTSIGKRRLDIVGCPGLAEISARISYFNYLGDYSASGWPTKLYEKVNIHHPIRVKDDLGAMEVATDHGVKVVTGIFNDLLTIYKICNDYQRGIFCRLCGNKCQAEGFLEQFGKR